MSVVGLSKASNTTLASDVRELTEVHLASLSYDLSQTQGWENALLILSTSMNYSICRAAGSSNNL